jgi:hypothetical protein
MTRRKPFLDPTKPYPNKLGLSVEEINLGYEAIAQVQKQQRQAAETRDKARKKKTKP